MLAKILNQRIKLSLAIFLTILITGIFSIDSYACTDSDGGKDYYNKGKITYTELEEEKIFFDRCIDEYISENKRLEEYYCDNEGRVQSILIECSVLCNDGRCISEKEYNDLFGCKDSDYGKDISKKGHVQGRVSLSSSIGNFSDYCVIGFTNRLMEYYCNHEDLVSVELIECNSECIEGECIDSKEIDCKDKFLSHYKTKELDNLKDNSCCTDLESCVYNNKCYFSRSIINLNNELMYCSQGYWIDCDESKEICTKSCGLNWAQLGESYFIGGYYKDIWSCCGDDLDEFFIIGEDNTSACCDKETDFVSEGICIPQEKMISDKKISYLSDDPDAQRIIDNMKKIEKDKLSELQEDPSNINESTLDSSENKNNQGNSSNISLFSKILDFFLNIFK